MAEPVNGGVAVAEFPLVRIFNFSTVLHWN